MATATLEMPLTIDFEAPPQEQVTGELTLAPKYLTKGDPLTLSWTSRNGISATLEGPGIPLQPVAVEGTYTLTPNESGVYTLVVKGEVASLSLTGIAVIQEVEPPPQPPPGEDGVVYDVSSDTLIDVVLVGSDPGPHGLHVDHSHPARFFREVTITAVKDGYWSDPTVWDLGRVPQYYDVVRIPSKMRFATDRSTKLTCNLFAINEDGTLIMTDPGAFTSEVVFADYDFDYALDPLQWGHGFIGLGVVSLSGAVKTGWTRLAAEVSAGATTLTFQEAVTGWQAGDRLVLPDTRQLVWSNRPDNPGGDHNYQWELPIIASVAGDGLSVTLESPGLLYSHLGVRDFSNNIITRYLCPVGNLSRNIIFRSANKDSHRGHTVYHGRATVGINDVEFRDLGRTTNEMVDNYDGVTTGTNQVGRYPIHFHHCLGPLGLPASTAQFSLTNCAIWNNDLANQDKTPRWTMSVHQSHYGLVQGNVFYNAAGACISLEDGNETDTIVDRNLIVRVSYSFLTENSRGSGDVGHTGAGIWSRGVSCFIRNNVVCNCSRGYIYSPYMSGTGDQLDFPAFKGADQRTDHIMPRPNVKILPVRQFFNNEVGGATMEGMEVWAIGSITNAGPGAGYQESVLQQLRCWHIADKMFYNYISAGLAIDQADWRGNWSNLYQRQGCYFGFFSSDYMFYDCRIRNSVIEGVVIGVLFSPNVGILPVGQTGIQEIINCTFRCHVGASCYLLWLAGNSAESISGRHVYIKNCVFLDSETDGLPIEYGAKSAISMDATPGWGPGSSNAHSLIVDNHVYVYDYQGVASDDFRCYWNEQAADVVLPMTEYFSGSTSMRIRGSPVAGLTNQQNLDTYSICWGNVIMPADATTRAGITGGKIKAF